MISSDMETPLVCRLTCKFHMVHGSWSMNMGHGRYTWTMSHGPYEIYMCSSLLLIHRNTDIVCRGELAVAGNCLKDVGAGRAEGHLRRERDGFSVRVWTGI